MTSFLTVAEAARLTGKSSSSIRRVIYPIVRDDNRSDRVHIQPNIEEVGQLRIRGENFAWRISEELLLRKVPVASGSESPAEDFGPKKPTHADGELLDMLRRELDIKNRQIGQQADLIAKQVELISGLSERLREGNLLIGSLQHRLALGNGRPAVADTPVKQTVSSSPKRKRRSTMPAQTNSPKRSFLSRLFR